MVRTNRSHALTEDSGYKSQRELGGEHGEKPGGGIEAGADLMLLEVIVEVSVVIVKKPRELVHLDLWGHTSPGVTLRFLLRVFSYLSHSGCERIITVLNILFGL